MKHPLTLLPFAMIIPAIGSPIGLDAISLDGSGYSEGSANLVGQSSLAEGFSGAWLQAYDGSGSPDVLSEGLGYPGVMTHGGSVGFSPGVDGRTGRLFETGYDDATDGITVYFSALLKLDGATGSYQALEFHDGGFDDGTHRKLQIAVGETGLSDAGLIPGADHFSVRLFNQNTAGYSADLGPSDDQVSLVVVKVEFSATADEDVVSVWRNPTDFADEGNNPPDYTGTGFNIQLDRVSLASFGPEAITFDELRIGDAWADVTGGDDYDTDEDGMRDAWERANGLNVGVNDAGLDSDEEGGADGLSNSRELALGTDPQKSDTDGDGLLDGVETGDGEWNGATETGTNPLKGDSDGDGLNDGEENCTGSFVSAEDTGTDPNDPDSDGDGLSDLDEILALTDPTDDGEVLPPGNLELIGSDYFDRLNGPIEGLVSGEGFDFQNSGSGFSGHTLTSSGWRAVFGVPRIECSSLRTANSGAARSFNGPGALDVSSGSFSSTSSNKTVYVGVMMERRSGVSYSGVSFMDGDLELVMVGVPGAASPVTSTRTFGIQDYTLDQEPAFSVNGLVPSERESDFIVAKLEYDVGRVTLYVNPPRLSPENVENAEAVNFIELGGETEVTGIRLASGGGGPVVWDDLVVSTSWEGLSTSPTDDDDDGLRDTWEATYPGDAGDDPDGDSLPNLEEMILGTHPGLADSDGDTLGDSEEGSLHNTNPCFADSDDDGTDDQIEIINGTDPNNPEAGESFAVDGMREFSYGEADSVQTIETGFGDNQSEWNAAYSRIDGDKLYLFFAGNVEANFNKVELFIDSTDAITSTTFDGAGNDGANAMNGMVFDEGFSPEYHFIFRRGGGKFDVDFADLATKEFASYLDVLAGGEEGSGVLDEVSIDTSTFDVLPEAMEFAYDGSNVGGIGGNAGNAADEAAAREVATGIEICLPLSTIGDPGTMKIMLLQNNSGHDYLANQTLGGLPVGTGNLGADGFGNGGAFSIDFTNYDGEQYYEIDPGAMPDVPGITVDRYDVEKGILYLALSNLEVGQKYHFEASPDLGGVSPFEAVAGTDFTAMEESRIYALASSGAKAFFRLVVGESP